MKPLSEQIAELIGPTVEGMGFDLVQVKFMEGKKSRLLQIMAERPDGSMTLDDCTAISRQLSAVLDVADIIPGMYRLEISSPGIDRPLTRRDDFNKFAGHLAKIETVLPIDGRKRFTGVLQATEGDEIGLEVDGREVLLPYADVQSAKLVLTDKLIQQVTGRQTADTRKKEKIS